MTFASLFETGGAMAAAAAATMRSKYGQHEGYFTEFALKVLSI